MRALLYAIAAPVMFGICILLFAGWIKLTVMLQAEILAATGDETLASICSALVFVGTPIGLVWGAVTDDSGEETGS